MRTNEPILTISVASRLLNLHPRTLMLYEKAGLLIPHRTSTKRRLFSIDDLNHIQFVKFLTQRQGINLQGVKAILYAIEAVEKHEINLKKILYPEFEPEVLL